jgi:hypothetical protein
MATDFVDLDVKLLLLRHGKAKVLRSLAQVENVSDVDIQRELAKVAKGKNGTRKSRSGASELIEKAHINDERSRQIIKSLIKEFEQKRFLPDHSQIERFCADHGVQAVFRNRYEALPLIISALARVSPDGLESLLKSVPAVPDSDSFAHLAEAIMRR